MKYISTQEYLSPYGPLLIGDYEGKLCLLDWQHRAKRSAVDRRLTAFLDAAYRDEATPLHQDAIAQLEAYFARQRTAFDLPLLLAGTEFQRKVWTALMEIPYGATVSYLGLSRRLGDEKAIRAVASANGANAISIIVPCHRVIGSNRSLTGYAGGIAVKQRLLELESNVQQGGLFE